MNAISILLLCVCLWHTHAFMSGCSHIRHIMKTRDMCRMASTDENTVETRKELWKKISNMERDAVELLSNPSPEDSEQNSEIAYKLLAQSAVLRKQDPFVELAEDYSAASKTSDEVACSDILLKMEESGLPPHIDDKVRSIVTPEVVEAEVHGSEGVSTSEESSSLEDDDVDMSSTFSDTVLKRFG